MLKKMIFLCLSIEVCLKTKKMKKKTKNKRKKERLSKIGTKSEDF